MMLSSSDLDTVLESVGRQRAAAEFESSYLDFKQPGATPKATFATLADAAVCFSNADGGVIVLGVNDKATKRHEALVGAEERHLSVEAIRRGIFERTRPPLTLMVLDRMVDGVRLVLIHVPPGVAIHSNTAGLATRRLGDQCVPFPPDEQRETLMARGHLDWSAQLNEGSVADISSAQLERFRRLLRGAGSEELAQLRDRMLLESLKLLGRGGRLTNAATIMLTSEDTLHEALPAYGYSYQYRPTPGSEAVNRFRGRRPFLEALELVLDAVRLRSEIQPLNVRGGQQLQLVDYPIDAVRELVVNAFIHRSYEALGSVDVEQSPEHLVVASPGALVAGVTPDNILVHASTPRNLLLTEVVARLHVAERTGQGVDRAYREMLRVGKRPPEFASEHDVRVVLRGGIGNSSFVRFINEMPQPLSSDVEVLLALSALRSRPSTHAAGLARLIQRSPSEAEEVLRRLADEETGILERTKRTARQAFPTYRLRSRPLAQLGRAVVYSGRPSDEADAKVIEHVYEFGYVTNATLQRLFDVHVFAARNMLTDLRRREILDKIGKARGGKGVRYGPGPKFPAKTRR
jgi:ATP-dependent DNA helicase RecG